MEHRASLVASAPTRLDFGGGWTDVPPFPEERGGFVCNLAVDRCATVRLRRADTHHPPALTALAQAALTVSRAEPLDIVVESDFPVGAGLGGSSAVGVALAAALARWQKRELTRSELAEWSRRVEAEQLGIAGGRQDHYAAAFGGALALEFGPSVTVTPIELAEETISALESRCILVYTGESRISGRTISGVLDAYAARDPKVIFALDRMAALARLMAAALVHGDVDALGALVGEHWMHQRNLHPGITTARIDTLISRALRAGALGAKPLGASGGGCVVIIAASEGVESLRRAIDGLGEELRFAVARTGVSVRES